jgi:hypothetical protein
VEEPEEKTSIGLGRGYFLKRFPSEGYYEIDEDVDEVL